MRSGDRVVRKISSEEASLVARLFEGDFAGASELREQAKRSFAKLEDFGGVVALVFSIPNDSPPALITHRIPVEAVASDVDGVKIHALAHVVDGRLKEIEIFREDSEPIRRMPLSTEFSITQN